MRIEIEIPEKFEVDYNTDKFKDFFERIFYDIGKGVLCGNYEKEIAEMFIKAFDESKTAYDTEKVVEELEEHKAQYGKLQLAHNDANMVCVYVGKEQAIDCAIEVVRKGGVE